MKILTVFGGIGGIRLRKLVKLGLQNAALSPTWRLYWRRALLSDSARELD